MAEPLNPGSDAIARYLKVGEQGLVAFFEEISSSAMRELAEHLPAVDGFRVGSPAGIKRQKAAPARNLSRPHPNSRDLKALYQVWRAWISAKLENAETVHEWINGVEEAVRAVSSHTRRSAIEQQAVTLFEKLKDESNANRCTREQIERLFEFSPFPETASGRAAITAAKGAEDVRRDATVSELSKRLQKDEDTIESLKSEVTRLSGRVDQTAGPAEERVRSIETALVELRAAGENDHRALHDANAGLLTVSEIAKNATTATTRIAERVLHLNSVVRGLEMNLESLDGDRKQIESLVLADKNTAVQLREFVELLDTLDASLLGAKRDIAAIRNHEATSDLIQALAGRVDRLEEGVAERTTIETISATTDARSFTPQIPGSAPVSGIRWDRLGHAREDAVLTSDADLVGCWCQTLQSLNLKTSGARVFAEECTAAILARQVIFLKGAFALPVARRLATSVGGGQGSARISIPVGLEDGERVRRAVEEALSGVSANFGTLVLEGLNRSSLDTMEEILADCASGMFGTRIAVFATLNVGFASLPLQVGYSAFGPIFDLDCLDWRSTDPSEPTWRQGVLPMTLGNELSKQIAGAGADIGEAIRLARIPSAGRNPLVERCFARAFEALQFLRAEQSVTALQSLFFGWVLPYWQMLDVEPEQMEAELDGGRVDGTTADPRLVVLAKPRSQP